MSDPLDLSALRKIAEGAMCMPAPWEPHVDECSFIDAADGEPIGQVFDHPEILAFWLAVTPPAVLALIARAEKAEAALGEARASGFDEAAKMIENRLGVSSIAKQLIGALRAAAADTGARVAQGRK